MGGRKKTAKEVKTAAAAKKARRRPGVQVVHDGLAMDDQEESMQTEKVWMPGMAVGEDEELQPDLSVYVMLHGFGVEWPCLSFDVTGSNNDFPMECTLVTGTQAPSASQNELLHLRWSNLTRTQREDDDDSEEEDEQPMQSVLHKQSHAGGSVNRVRALSGTAVTAAWSSEEAVVHVWDMQQGLKMGVVSGHSTEGYGLAWNPHTKQLLSSDCNGSILLTDTSFATTGKFSASAHSVEDLAWSPGEGTVFASASVDGSVAIWDVRMGSKPALMKSVHTADVNVLSWNPCVQHLLATGCDDGTFATWDLRSFTGPSLMSFAWHKGAVTSLEWHPQDASVLAVAGADDQITLWDFAVEPDDDTPTESTAELDRDVPPPLLFVHHQRDPKELHWLPNAPGVLACTGIDGFSIFQTISV